jgi:ribose-phosphate pyrophosphokinase
MQIAGADVVIIDDMVDTAGTLSSISKRLDLAGARNVYVCASHGLFTESSMELIENSPVKKVIVTNTLPMPKVATSKVVQVSIAPMLAHVILAEHFRSLEQGGFEDEEFEMED